MKSLKGFAVGALGVAVLAYVAPAVAHCGKCAVDCKELVKLMESGKATAASMIAAAETASKGKAIGMYSSLDKGKMSAKVLCAVGDKVQSVEVGADAKAGKVDEAKGAKADAAKAMETAKLTAAKVVEAAETHSKGKALALVSTATGGKATYEVYALAGDKLQKVKVDETGKATAMEEAKSLPAEEVKPAPKGG